MTANKMCRNYWLFAFLASLAFTSTPGSTLNAIERTASTTATIAAVAEGVEGTTTSSDTSWSMESTSSRSTAAALQQATTIKMSSILVDTLNDKTLLKTASKTTTTATTTEAATEAATLPTTATSLTEIPSEFISASQTTIAMTTTTFAKAPTLITEAAGADAVQQQLKEKGKLSCNDEQTTTASGSCNNAKVKNLMKPTTMAAQDDGTTMVTTMATTSREEQTTESSKKQPLEAARAKLTTAVKPIALEMPITASNEQQMQSDNNSGSNDNHKLESETEYNFIDYSRQQRLQQQTPQWLPQELNNRKPSNSESKLKKQELNQQQHLVATHPIKAVVVQHQTHIKYSKLIPTTAAAAANMPSALVSLNNNNNYPNLKTKSNINANSVKASDVNMQQHGRLYTNTKLNATLTAAAAAAAAASLNQTTPSPSISYSTPAMPTTMKTKLTTRRRRPAVTTTIKPPPTIDDYATITSQAGTHAYLPCNVKQLIKKPISWLRKSDGHILTVDQTTFIADQRFQSIYTSNPEHWSLQIKYVQLKDEGIYECQVSTEPKASAIVTLRVVEPKTELIGESTRHVKAGSQVKLHCIISQALEPPLFINWFYNQKQIYLHNRKGWRTEIERIELPAEVPTTTTTTTTSTTTTTTTVAPISTTSSNSDFNDTGLTASSTLTYASSTIQAIAENVSGGSGNVVGDFRNDSVADLASSSSLSAMIDDNLTVANSILANAAGIELMAESNTLHETSSSSTTLNASTTTEAFATTTILPASTLMTGQLPRPTITTITPIHEIRHITTASLIIPSVEKLDSGNYTCSPSNSIARTVVLHVLNGEYSASAITSGVSGQFQHMKFKSINENNNNYRNRDNGRIWHCQWFNFTIIIGLLWIMKFLLEQKEEQQLHLQILCQYCWQRMPQARTSTAAAVLNKSDDNNCISVCNYKNNNKNNNKNSKTMKERHSSSTDNFQLNSNSGNQCSREIFWLTKDTGKWQQTIATTTLTASNNDINTNTSGALRNDNKINEIQLKDKT